MTQSVSRSEDSRGTFLHKYLNNGCECYLERVDFAPLVSLQMWVKTGSLDEREHEFGMAHVLEHMLFKGTQRFPKTGEVARLVESAGGEINAYTTFDHTVFYINAPREFAYQGAELLFDVVSASLLDAQELERELEVVIEEIRRSRDNPGALLSKQLFAKVFAGHPMARPVIGYEDVVKNFNRENLLAFYKRWYIPNNMFFVAAGDFQTAEMNAHLEMLSQRFAPGSLPERIWSREHSRPQQKIPDCDVLHGPYQETRLYFVVPAPRLEEDQTPAWDIFASIFGHGDSSRLTQSVKDEAQLVTGIDASLYTPRFPYGFIGFSFFARTQTAIAALKAAVLEAAHLAKEGPSQAELQRVLTAAKAERIYSRESIEGLVRSTGGNLLTTAKLDFDNRYRDKLNRIKLEQVQSCAAAFCKQVIEGQVICVAASNRDHSDLISAEILKKAVCEAQELVQNELAGFSSRGSEQRSNAAIQSHVQSEKSQRNPNVFHKSVTLAEQTKLHFNYRTSQRLPVASHVMVWRWGQFEEIPEKTGLNALLAQMLTRGTTRHSYRSFVNELEDMGASISAFSSRDIFGLRLDALSDVQPRALKMMLDCLCRPALEAEQFERIVRETEEVLVGQKDSPGARLSRLTGPLYFDSHPYGRPSLGTLDTIQNITLTDVQTQWQRLLLAEKIVFSGAGDFNYEACFEHIAEELNGIAMQRTARLKSLSPLKNPELVQQKNHLPRVSFDELDREQAHISFGVPGYSLSNRERTALEVACAILGGQGGRLFLDLRDAQSLAYSVGCSQSPGLWGGTFTSYIGTAAAKSQQAMTGLKLHLERIAAEHPPEDELQRAKNTLLGSQSLDSQHHHYQASQLAMSDVYGLGFDNFLGFKERIEAVTAADVSAAVAQLLQANQPRIAVVGPQGTWVPELNDSLCSWV